MLYDTVDWIIQLIGIKNGAFLCLWLSELHTIFNYILMAQKY